jgi:hypothetical protein
VSRTAAPSADAALGTAPDILVKHTVVFASALQGVIALILHKQLPLTPANAKAFVADVRRMLIRGMQ